MSFVDLAKLTMHRQTEMEGRINTFNEKCDRAISDIKKLKMQAHNFLSQLNCDPVELKERFLTLMKKLDEYTYLITDFNLAIAQIDIGSEHTPEQDNSLCLPLSTTSYTFNPNNLMDALSEPAPSTSCACSNLCPPEKPKRNKVPKQEQVLIEFSSASTSYESVPCRKSEMVAKEVQCSLGNETKCVNVEDKKRIKASKAQIKYLMNYMKVHQDIAKGYSKSSLEERIRLQKKWERLTTALNSIKGPVKTVMKWKQAWRDLKCNFRKTSGRELSADEEQAVSASAGWLDPLTVYIIEEAANNEIRETPASPRSSPKRSERTTRGPSPHTKQCCLANMKRNKATSAQLLYLSDYMRVNPDMAASRLNSSRNQQHELQIKWRNLAHKLNCMGGPIKTVKKWKQAWRDLKSNRKRGQTQEMSANEEQISSVTEPQEIYITDEIVNTEVTESPASPYSQRSMPSPKPEFLNGPGPSRPEKCKGYQCRPVLYLTRLKINKGSRTIPKILPHL